MTVLYGVVGDSQAQGLLLDNALPTLLGPALVARHAHPGWSTRRLRDEGMINAALRELLAARSPAGDRSPTRRVLIVAAGGNDTPPSSDASRAAYTTMLRGIVENVAGRGVSIVWVGPVFALTSPDSSQHPQVAEAQRAALAGTRAKWVDAQPLSRDLARTTNVHFTAPNYGVFAERVMGEVRSITPGDAAAGAGMLVLVGAVLVGSWLVFGNKGLATAALVLPGVPPL